MKREAVVTKFTCDICAKDIPLTPAVTEKRIKHLTTSVYSTFYASPAGIGGQIEGTYQDICDECSRELMNTLERLLKNKVIEKTITGMLEIKHVENLDEILEVNT